MNTANNIQYKGLNGPPTDNEDEDFPPQFTTLLHEQEKCKFNFYAFNYAIKIKYLNESSSMESY